MNPALHLTAAEIKLFQALPKELTKDWEATEETVVFTDTPEKMQIRMRNLTVHDPKLVALKAKAQSITTEKEFAALTGDIDFATIDQEDLIELYFAIGPDALTVFIGDALKHTKTSDDMIGLASLTIIRHGLLLSLTSTPIPTP